MNSSPELALEKPMEVSPIVFVLRHLIGVSIILLVLPFYRLGNFYESFGYWLGSLAITSLGAAIITGGGYVYFTQKVKGKVIRIFVTCVWVIAFFLLFGQWVVPGLVAKSIASGAAQANQITPPQVEKVLVPEPIAISPAFDPPHNRDSDRMANFEQQRNMLLGSWTCGYTQYKFEAHGTVEKDTKNLNKSLSRWTFEFSEPYSKLSISSYNSDAYAPWVLSLREISPKSMTLIAPTGALIECARKKASAQSAAK